jgi:hypothetical protein
MPATTSNPTEAKRLQRITELLNRLASYDDLRAACLLGLMDDQTLHPTPRLAQAGFKLNEGATTRQLFDFAGPRLGRTTRFDRELRDAVWPRLRELGIIQRAYRLTDAEFKATGEQMRYGSHEKAKSPNNSYALTDDARALLVNTADADWVAALDAFVKDAPNRRLRVIQAAAAAPVAATSDHAKLIRDAADTLLATVLSDYELVFVDDADEERVKDEWKDELDKRGLLPDLESLWPDAILVRDSDKSIWFIDAVTSDGEVDTTRHDELDEWARDRGYTPAGYTTAYATWKRAGARQGKMKNLAVGSTVWIGEDGGKLFTVGSLADGN